MCPKQKQQMLSLQHADIPVCAYYTLIVCVTKWPLIRYMSYICTIFDEKLLYTEKNYTHPIHFVKRSPARHFNPNPRTVVFEICIFAGTCYSHQAILFNRCAYAVWLTLYLSQNKSTLCHHNEIKSIAESSKTLQNFMHPDRVQQALMGL